MTESRELYETVIKNDYCIGCGACSVVKNSPFNTKINKFGNIVATVKEEDLDQSTASVLSVCPFSNNSKNENELGELLFPNNIKNTEIGNYIKCYAGNVKVNNFRKNGSSGGFGKWIGYKLLVENEIDFFVQLKSNSSQSSDVPLFDFDIFSSSEEVIKGSKSAYYPTSLEGVLNRIKRTEGRYAITGVPCFIKSLRLLSLHDSILRDRIKYTIGIICGGMKSANHSKMIGWQLGISPENLISIDFRRKYNDRPATEKIYQVWSNNDNKERFDNANDLVGTDYGAGFFKPKACEYCDDVVGETADVSIGDAWLPNFRSDPEGNSLIIVRNTVIAKILETASLDDLINISEISEEEAVNSQMGGFRHRREGLSYRLSKKMKDNVWTPKKRILPGSISVSPKRMRIYELREKIAIKSHGAFLQAMENNNLNIFYKEMKFLVYRYKVANEKDFFSKVKNKIKNKFLKK